MKLIILGLCILLTNINATQALRCMQGVNYSNITVDEWDKPEFIECTLVYATISAVRMLKLKPNTVSLPSTEYKCFHLVYEDVKRRYETAIVKGCIYKNQDVCSAKFKKPTIREVFCSQCNEDECNSSIRFASDWKILGLTIFAILAYLMQ